MLFALLAAFLFACSGVSAQRASRLLGSIKANVFRLSISLIVLATWAACTGGVIWWSESTLRLYASGALGFGLGDMALFFALPRIGARQSLLINLCTAPVFGLLGDRWLMGTGMVPVQILSCALILAGVSQAVMGKGGSQQVSGSRWIGLVAALIAGFGQGGGSALSRWSHEAQASEGHVLASHVETFLRVAPGTLVAVGFWAAVRACKIHAPWAGSRPFSPTGGAWVVANALFGAVLGVTCFQHALLSASSAVVLSITATAPIMVMPITYYSEGDAPATRSVLGAIIAVAGVALLRSTT